MAGEIVRGASAGAARAGCCRDLRDPRPQLFNHTGGSTTWADSNAHRLQWEKAPAVILQVRQRHPVCGSALPNREVHPELPRMTALALAGGIRFGLVPASDRRQVLLPSRGSSPPYVLVGHQWVITVAYASLYRNDVAGMVLVDTSHRSGKPLPPNLRIWRHLAARKHSSWNTPRHLVFPTAQACAMKSQCSARPSAAACARRRG